MKYELRQNQKVALEACAEFLAQENPEPGVVVAPTGYGKSILIGAVANLCKSSVIVLQPSVELLKQNLEKYESYGNYASVYSASAGQKEMGHVTFATIGTIKKMGAEFRKRGVKILLVDECHASYPPEKGSMFRDFIDDLKPTHIIGFTATPFRLKTYGDMTNNWTQLNMLIKGKPVVFKQIIHVTQIQELVRDKFWAKLNYELLDFDTSTLKLNSTGAEYTEQSVQRAVLEQGVNDNIFKRCKRLLSEGKNALVFMDSVENAKILAERLGSEAACVDGSMDKHLRNKIVTDFKNNKIKIVTNYSLMGIGFDKPDLQTVIMGRPTNSLALLYQIFGRGVRNPLYPNVKECLIIDYCNNVKRFGKIEELKIINKENYGWGVFSNTHLLTGVPMGSELTLEQLDEVIRLRKEDLSDFKLSFGVHKGKRLSEIPESYRVWLVKNLDGFYSLSAEDKNIIREQCIRLQGKGVEVAYDPRSVILFDLNNISFILHKAKKLHLEGLEEYVSKWFSRCSTSNFRVVVDSSKMSYWRKKIYPEYKENRKPVEDAKFTKALFDLKNKLKSKDYLLVHEGLEADDIISSFARCEDYDRITCVSADSDFQQLSFYSRFDQISPLTNVDVKVSKKDAVEVLITKVLKGDSKDNIKKSHKQRCVKSEEMEEITNVVFKRIVQEVVYNPEIKAQDLPLREIIWEELSSRVTMDRGLFDLNFTLINLIQDEKLKNNIIV